MQIEIIKNQLHLDIYGFSGTAVGNDYVGMAFKLADKMWQTVKANSLKNKGRNVWVYQPNEGVFAGVELDSVPGPAIALEHKEIILSHYAYYKHIGPYNLIRQTGQGMRDELKKRGLKTISPYIEIYGHWMQDETKLETELLMAVE